MGVLLHYFRRRGRVTWRAGHSTEKQSEAVVSVAGWGVGQAISLCGYLRCFLVVLLCVSSVRT